MVDAPPDDEEDSAATDFKIALGVGLRAATGEVVELSLRARDGYRGSICLNSAHDRAGAAAASVEAEATATTVDQNVANLARLHEARKLIDGKDWIASAEATQRHDWLARGEDDRGGGIGVRGRDEVLRGALIG